MNNNIVSQVKPMQTTLQLDLWAAANDVEYSCPLPHGHLSIVARPNFCVVGCTVVLVSLEAVTHDTSNPGCQTVASSAIKNSPL